MKIALCLSGFMRTFEETFMSLQRNFLSINNNVDVFIHTWNKLDRHIDNLPIDTIKNIYKPQNIQIEKLKNFDISPLIHDKNIKHKRDVHGIFSMYYKIKACNDLKTQYEKENNFTYDCVIRFRSDIELKENLDISKYDLSKINVPNFGDYFGVNDQLAFSNSKNMDIYSSTFDYLNEYIKDIIQTDPELFLQTHMLTNGLKIKRFPLKYDLKCHNSLLNNESREKMWVEKVRE